MDLALSAGLYAGLIALLASWLWPGRGRIAGDRLTRRVRWTGAAAVAAALATPGCEATVSSPLTSLDSASPRWQFRERHQLWVDAPPDVVARAVRAATADEIAGFQTLTAIRRFGRSGPESVLASPGSVPLLEVVTRTTFASLTDTPAEIVIGTLVAGAARHRLPSSLTDYGALDRVPGVTKATMNFHLTPEGRGTRLTTETRVFATDGWRRWGFGWYWRVIYPGSAIIRVAWLRAIRQRAERARHG